MVFYFTVGLNPSAERVGYWFLFYFLYTSFCTYFGIMLSILMPNQETAQVAGTALLSIWNQFCGFLAPSKDIPQVWAQPEAGANVADPHSGVGAACRYGCSCTTSTRSRGRSEGCFPLSTTVSTATATH